MLGSPTRSRTKAANPPLEPRDATSRSWSTGSSRTLRQAHRDRDDCSRSLYFSAPSSRARSPAGPVRARFAYTRKKMGFLLFLPSALDPHAGPVRGLARQVLPPAPGRDRDHRRGDRPGRHRLREQSGAARRRALFACAGPTPPVRRAVRGSPQVEISTLDATASPPRCARASSTRRARPPSAQGRRGATTSGPRRAPRHRERCAPCSRQRDPLPSPTTGTTWPSRSRPGLRARWRWIDDQAKASRPLRGSIFPVRGDAGAQPQAGLPAARDARARHRATGPQAPVGIGGVTSSLTSSSASMRRAVSSLMASAAAARAAAALGRDRPRGEAAGPRRCGPRQRCRPPALARATRPCPRSATAARSRRP